MSDEIIQDEWSGCYRGGWSDLLHPAAFAHPAKVARGLAERIYEHVIAEGWAVPGSTVIDPFGGICGFGFHAMVNGLHFVGVELEEKFVGLGNQNIALWNDRYSRMPQWGTARLLNDDSRKLASVISEASLSVSSPPYAAGCAHNGGDDPKPETLQGGDYHGVGLSVSSPPYANDTVNNRNGIDLSLIKKPGGHNSQSRVMSGYGETNGQIGSMREGDHSLAITSPPYNPPMSQDHNGSRGGSRGTTPSEKGAFVKYGTSEGQLEGMSMEGHALAVSSPPFGGSTAAEHNPDNMTAGRGRRGGDAANRVKQDYAPLNTEGNLQNAPMNGHDLAVSSPPFPQPYTNGGGINVKGYGDGSDKVGERTYQSKGGERSVGNLETMEAAGFDAAITSPPYEGLRMDGGKLTKEQESGMRPYSNAPVDAWFTTRDQANIANNHPETFWSASRTILEQLHQVLAPNAHAVFVVKAFVRNKQIVDFPAQWAQLCEAVGFRLIHDHHALLTEEHGEQHRLDGGSDITTVARKSFFRRLAESKGSPKIDYENVLCFEKTA